MTVKLCWWEELVMGTRVRLADSGWQILMVAGLLQVSGIAVCSSRLIDHHSHSDDVKDVSMIEGRRWTGIYLTTETIAERSAAWVVHQSRMHPVGLSFAGKRFA